MKTLLSIKPLVVASAMFFINSASQAQTPVPPSDAVRSVLSSRSPIVSEEYPEWLTGGLQHGAHVVSEEYPEWLTAKRPVPPLTDAQLDAMILDALAGVRPDNVPAAPTTK